MHSFSSLSNNMSLCVHIVIKEAFMPINYLSHLFGTTVNSVMHQHIFIMKEIMALYMF